VALAALAELREKIPFRTATVQLIRDGMRSVLAGSGYDDRIPDRTLLRPVSFDPLVGRVVNAREPLILSDTSHEPDWQSRPPTKDVNSWAGIPLIYEDEVIGLVTLDHEQPGYYQQSLKGLLVEFAEQLAPRVWQAKMQDSSERLARNMQIFHEVFQAISEKLDIHDLLQTIAFQVAKRLNCSHCTIFLAEPQEDGEQVLVAKVTHGDFPGPLTRRFKSGEGLAGWVFSKGESVLLPDASEDDRFSPSRAQRGTARSMLVAPVKVGDQTIGVISVDQDEFGWFNVSDQQLVDALAVQAGIAIQRSTALKLLHDITARIISPSLDVSEILKEVVSGAIRLTNTTTGVIHLIGEDGMSVTDRFHSGDFDHPQPRMDNPNGLTRTTISTGDVLIIPNTSEDARVQPLLQRVFRSMIVVPMKIQDQVIGVLYLDDKNQHNFTQIEVTCLRTLASEAAIAIENARLLDRLHRELKSHRLLEDILKKLSGQGPDQEKTLYSVAAAIREILGEAVSVTINLYKREEDSFGRHYAYGPLKDELSDYPRPAGTGRHVVSTGEPLYFEDVTNPPDGAPTIRDEGVALGIKSLVVIPLRGHEQIVGVLFIHSQRPLSFDEDTRGILEMFAGHAGIAIENAGLHASAQLQGALVKAADLGFLAGGIAHEFRNNLQNMEALTYEIERLLAQDGRAVLTDQLRSEMARALKTIGVFQSFARQRDVVETFNLDELIKRILGISAQRLKDHDIELKFVNAGVKDVTMNVSFVSSVVLNLLRNAIDALESKASGPKIVELELSPHAGGNIAIVARDSGPGISPNELTELFIPFRTTKAAIGGLGLGLFWIQRIVSQMGGKIDVESPNNWGGATFRVVLPEKQKRERPED
jgi:GAF domain-containing protein